MTTEYRTLRPRDRKRIICQGHGCRSHAGIVRLERATVGRRTGLVATYLCPRCARRVKGWPAC